MAPPLLPLTRLLQCSACSEHVKSSEDACPHCGASLGTRHGLLARAAGVAFAGVLLASCNGGKTGESETETGTGSSSTDSGSGSSSTDSGSGSTVVDTTIENISEAAYGVPTSSFTSEFTTTDSEGDSDSTTGGSESSGTTVVDTSASESSGDSSSTGDTGTSTMTGGPEYGVPDTTGFPEPDYGVPGTT